LPSLRHAICCGRCVAICSRWWRSLSARALRSRSM
jgi:hypothetical protein